MSAMMKSNISEKSLLKCLDSIVSRAPRLINGMLADTVEGEAEDYDQPCEVEESMSYLKNALNMTGTQVILFALILEKAVGRSVSPNDISRHLQISNLRFMTYSKELDGLVRRRLVRRIRDRWDDISYNIPYKVRSDIQDNFVPQPDTYSGMSSIALLRAADSLFANKFRNTIDGDTLELELDCLLKANPEDAFIKSFEAMGIQDMKMANQIIFLFLVTRCIFNEDTSFNEYKLDRVLGGNADEVEFSISEIFSCDNKENPLMTNKVIEYSYENGIADKSSIKLSDEAYDLYVKNYLPHSQSQNYRNVIKVESIKGKELFYNDGEAAQIERLSSLLEGENFKRVCARLGDKGYRKGVCCLLYGGPGTGKTETVYQLARRSGRSIYMVDVTELKSKWVGESERNVKALFDRYKSMVRNSELEPILLFNEADAVLGVRSTDASSAVSKMENTLQNIILQEMESLEGIMIATTNLTCNFDSAFERRFLYKIHLSNPSEKARASIWESMIEGLSSHDALQLASEYNLSGGQIENVSRKMMVDYIIDGAAPNLNAIRKLCNVESIKSLKGERRGAMVGFSI